MKKILIILISFLYEKFTIPPRYNHKKLIKFIEKKKDWWCTYNLHKYANPSWFEEWLENK